MKYVKRYLNNSHEADRHIEQPGRESGRSVSVTYELLGFLDAEKAAVLELSVLKKEATYVERTST
ncbi:MAG TPA: hypothetical protein VIX90_12220 [Edaphobacter sp.]